MQLTLERLQFDGHIVDCDGKGAFDRAWLRGREDVKEGIVVAAPIQFNSVLCFTGGEGIRITARFRVATPPSENELVTIRGRALIGGSVLEWAHQMEVSAASTALTELETQKMVSVATLPLCVGRYRDVAISWVAEVRGAITSLGATTHLIYVLLPPVPNMQTTPGTSSGHEERKEQEEEKRNSQFAPEEQKEEGGLREVHQRGASSGPLAQVISEEPEVEPSRGPYYWTLLDFTCGPAHSVMTEAELVNRSYSALAKKKGDNNGPIRARDGKKMSYWRDGTGSFPSNEAGNMLQAENGDGTCSAWADLLVRMFAIHGVTAKIVKLVLIDRNNRYFFVVKSDAEGLGNSHPPVGFQDHAIVKHDERYYDPSYGLPPKSSLLDWENAAIAGTWNFITEKHSWDEYWIDGHRMRRPQAECDVTIRIEGDPALLHEEAPEQAYADRNSFLETGQADGARPGLCHNSEYGLDENIDQEDLDVQGDPDSA